MPQRSYLACLLALGSVGLTTLRPAAAAAPLPAGVVAEASVEGITAYRLANGLKVLLFPDPTKDTCTVNVTYLVGSRYENYGEGGMAHLFEHLMFRSALRHKAMKSEMSKRGASWNGTTSIDRTNFFETFQASDANLDWALDLESDRMVNLQIGREDIAAERTIVGNEMDAGENNAIGQLVQRMMSTAYLWHNYGRPTIGLRSDLDVVPLERVQAFYRMYYQPDNAVLVVAGKIDLAKTLRLVAGKFGALPTPTRKLLPTYTVEPPQDGERQVSLRRVGGQNGVGLAYHVPAGSHPDAAAVNVLAWILGDDAAGRLAEALVKPGKAVAVFGFNWQLRDPGLLMAGAIVKPDGDLAVARDGLLAVVEGFAKQPLTAAEVDRAKTALLKDIDLSLNNPQAIAIELSEWASMGDWRLFFINRDRLKAVTAEDVQRVAVAYCRPTNRTLGVFEATKAPDRVELPKPVDIDALVKDYKGHETVSQGEAFDPTPANIEQRTRRAATPSGLKLSLLPKQTRGNTVVLQLSLHFGDVESLKGKATVGAMAGRLLMRGTPQHTRQQLQDDLAKLKADVAVTGSPSNASASIQTTRANLLPALALVAEMLKSSSFPTNEFELARTEWLAGIADERVDPQGVARMRLGRTQNPYPQGDVRYAETFEEQVASIQALTPEAVRTFWHDFAGADHGELSVVGDFDAAGLPAAVEQLLGGWKSAAGYTRVPRPFIALKPERIVESTPDKPNAIYFGLTNLELRDDDPETPAMEVVSHLLGGSADSRLFKRIREKDGISYGVGTGFEAGSVEKRASLYVYAIFPPKQQANLEKALAEELARVLKDGFSAEEVASGKQALLRERRNGRNSDAGLAGALNDQRYLGRTFAWEQTEDQRLEALTAAQVNAALRKYIKPDGLVVVQVGDFPKP